MTLELKARINEMRYESPTVVSVELAPIAGAFPAFDPGAHIEMALGPDMRRSYSLLDADARRYRIAVHRDPASRGGSIFVHDRLRVGDIVSLSRPENNFRLDESAAGIVLIAGGIGVTPILCMARRLAARGAPFVLHYGARDRAGAAFLPEIAALTGAPGRVNLHFDDEAGGVLDIAALVGSSPPGAQFYCCGPAPMLESFKRATAHLPRDAVHFEYFAAAEAAARDGGFEVALARRKRVLRIPSGQTILEVLLSEKIHVAVSCAQGVCGACETSVIDGVPDHRDSYLTDAEKAANTSIMICCSGAKTSRLVLDL